MCIPNPAGEIVNLLVMKDYKSLFKLRSEDHYLNCAYMSPVLQSVEEAGIRALEKRRNPQDFGLDDFFSPVSKLKALFSRLINNSDPERIALIPSVSYGLANAANNVIVKKGGNIVLLEGQFPSNYYIWKRLADQSGAKIKMIARPKAGELWTDLILESIDSHTIAVSMAPIHWADGYKFDLESIGRKCNACEAFFILDGTQSIGAMPFDLARCQADAVICAGYKWLLGAYGMGMAYYGPRFDNGNALEESWYAKIGSDEFAGLVDYCEEFRPKAWRYSVGESSNFIYVDMLLAALTQILEWRVETITTHCKEISTSFKERLQQIGFHTENSLNLSEHLFGLLPPENFFFETFQELCAEHRVFVSKRGDFIRVSPHLYNTPNDFLALETCLKNSII